MPIPSHSSAPCAISKEDIAAATDRLVTAWAFPGDTCHSPDAYTMVQASVLSNMLRNRMAELAITGVNPLAYSIKELLPDVVPHEIEVRDPNFD